MTTTLTPGAAVIIEDVDSRFNGYHGVVMRDDDMTGPSEFRVGLPRQCGWIHGHVIYVARESVRKRPPS